MSFRCAFDHSLWHDEVANSINANSSKSKNNPLNDAKDSTSSQRRIGSVRPTHASQSNATSQHANSNTSALTPAYRYSVPVTT